MGCAGSAPRPGLATPISDDIQVENNGYENTKLEAVETTAVVEHNIDQILKHENTKNLSKDFSADAFHQFHSDCDIIEDKLDFSVDSNTSETEENIFDMDKEIVASGKVAFSDVIHKIGEDVEINNEVKELETIIENVVMNDENAAIKVEKEEIPPNEEKEETSPKEEKEETPAEPVTESEEKEKEAEDVVKEDSNNNDKDSVHEELDTNNVEDDNEGSEAASSPSSLGDRRPTKWEALADVVAELPPRLSVDALTGQIFSASKRD